MIMKKLLVLFVACSFMVSCVDYYVSPDGQKYSNWAFRTQIAERNYDNTVIRSIMIGENALTGNYNQRQLENIETALLDNRLEEGELRNSLLRKVQKNNDAIKMCNAGADVRVPL
jgi:hypothetical protein